MRYFKNFSGFTLLFGLGLIIAATLAGCASGPEPVPRKLADSSKEIKLEPTWTIKTPNSIQSGLESTIEIYVVGDEFYPSFFWIRERGNFNLDEVERLAAITFLRQKGVDTDNAEIKNEQKLMLVYPRKEDAANYEQDKEDTEIIIGINE